MDLNTLLYGLKYTHMINNLFFFYLHIKKGVTMKLKKSERLNYNIQIMNGEIKEVFVKNTKLKTKSVFKPFEIVFIKDAIQINQTFDSYIKYKNVSKIEKIEETLIIECNDIEIH